MLVQKLIDFFVTKNTRYRIHWCVVYLGGEPLEPSSSVDVGEPVKHGQEKK